MNFLLWALLPVLLPFSLAALEPARTAPMGAEKRQAIFLRAESGEGLIAFLPEGKTGWRLHLYPMMGSVAAFAVADFDGDGIADLALIKSSGDFGTLMGDGHGGFDLKSNSHGVLHGFIPSALQVEDLNGDGHPDLALFDGKRRLDLKNDGFGNLEAAAAAKAAPPAMPATLAADFFGHGAPDRIVVRDDRVLIHPARGGSPVEMISRDVIRGVALGDFFGDGGMELALIGLGARPRLQIISAVAGASAGNDAASFSIITPEFPAATCSVSVVAGPAFGPSTCNINVNDTVSWSGLGAFHTVTSIDSLNCGLACNNKFCSPASASSYSHQFLSTSEASVYKCNPHCATFGMTGVVNVTAPATPGSVPDTGTPFKIKKSATAGSLDLTWGASCSLTATGFGIYQGTIGATFAYNHTAMTGQCAKTATSATVVPAVGNTYYLLVAHTANNDGSYGKNTANVEIPIGTTVCLAQNLSGSC